MFLSFFVLLFSCPIEYNKTASPSRIHEDENREIGGKKHIQGEIVGSSTIYS